MPPFSPEEQDKVYPVMQGFDITNTIMDIEKHIHVNYNETDLEIHITFHLTIGS